MLDHDTPAQARARTGRKQFLFCVTGLSARNEILLKSLMRLLHGVTRYDWVYSPSGQDLAVVATGTPELPAAKSDLSGPPEFSARACLWVGDACEGKPFRVALPLHCKELESELNKVGEWLVAQPAPAAASEANTVFQLLRWPPTAFLSTPERTKAATLLLKAPIKFDVLARRAGMSAEDCRLFIAVLPHMKHSVPEPDSLALERFFDAPSQPPENPGLSTFSITKSVSTLMTSVSRSGIVARIRDRLGLES